MCDGEPRLGADGGCELFGGSLNIAGVQQKITQVVACLGKIWVITHSRGKLLSSFVDFSLLPEHAASIVVSIRIRRVFGQGASKLLGSAG